MAQTRKDGGFTLIELMVVVAIVGLLSTVASFLIKPSSYNKSARGTAERIAGMMDVARERSVATRRWHRVGVQESRIDLFQATTTGLGTPGAWALIDSFLLPTGVTVNSTDTRPHTATGDSVPATGTGLPADIDFSPDGTAVSGATVFVGAGNNQQQARALLFGASATVIAYDSW